MANSDESLPISDAADSLDPAASVPEAAALDTIDALAGWLAERKLVRPLVLCGPSRRHIGALSDTLSGLELAIFDGAEVHVPRARVDAALARFSDHRADVIIALGGGAAIGLGKALRLQTDATPFVAIPTTYAGSEATSIYGVKDGEDKETGRDTRVVPNLVVYEPAFTRSMPAALTVSSLMNALAHPVSVLAALAEAGPELDSADLRRRRAAALRAAAKVYEALMRLLNRGDDAITRNEAARAAADAARVLEAGPLGAQHRVAHRLGGRLGLAHAPLHANLLLRFLDEFRRSHPAEYRRLSDSLRDAEPLRMLGDALERGGVPPSLAQMGADWPAIEGALRGLEDASADRLRAWVYDAWLGRRPCEQLRWVDATGLEPSGGNPRGPYCAWGCAPEDARRIVVAVHGRGATDTHIVMRARELVGDDPETLVIAPNASGRAWYGASYRRADQENPEALEAALVTIRQAVRDARSMSPHADITLFGFSQGACLVLEAAARGDEGRRLDLAAVVAIGGARIGVPGSQVAPVSQGGCDCLVGISREDPWVDAADVVASAEALAEAGAKLELRMESGDAHEISARQRIEARALILEHGDVEGTEVQWGFGASFQCEALPGALPRGQNTPAPAPYGLFAEQINGTSMVAPRSHNQRTWMYRIRPAAGAPAFEELSHPGVGETWVDRPVEVNLVAHRPLELPTQPTDFVDGLRSYGGSGRAQGRRGFAIHLYAANRSMEHRTFYDADGDLLIVPELGALTLRTELGVLELAPGEVAIIPRGIRFSVLLRDEAARGWVGEVFGQHFELPERGPVGSNALADARHFRAPTPWFEDRLDPGHRLTVKAGGRLAECRVDYSPFDVVAWHGNYVPYVYDLLSFSPVGNVREDHPDPSVNLVLVSPLDDPAADALDLVVFVPRWDVSEHSFRPPFFHRNVTMEFNGVIRQPPRKGSPFEPGFTFITPPMTAHGVMDRAVDAAIAAAANEQLSPSRGSERSLWFQFESSLPISLTTWALEREGRVDGWDARWGRYRPHYRGPHDFLPDVEIGTGADADED